MYERRSASKLTFCLCPMPHANFFDHSNSDIWRNYPKLMRTLYRLLYLTTKQGSSTSVAASVMEFSDVSSDAIYLQPYRLPSLNFLRRKKRQSTPHPMFEMLGPYQGYVVSKPRLPGDDGIRACQSLFSVCEELAGCKFN